MLVEGHFCSVLLCTTTTADKEPDYCKQEKKQHILQETVVHLVQLSLVFVCMCLTLYVEMGLLRP